MKKPIPYAEALLSVGCGVNISFALTRKGDPALIAIHSGTNTEYPLRLTRGRLSLLAKVGASIDDLSALQGPADFDFVASSRLLLSGLANVPASSRDPLFAEFLLVEDSRGVALLVEGAVTLSDGSVLPVLAKVPAPPEGSTRLLEVNKELGIDSAGAFFLPEALFHQIDFDRLGAGNTEIVIEPDTGDPDIDDALLTLQENVELSLQGTFELRM